MKTHNRFVCEYENITESGVIKISIGSYTWCRCCFRYIKRHAFLFSHLNIFSVLIAECALNKELYSCGCHSFISSLSFSSSLFFGGDTWMNREVPFWKEKKSINSRVLVFSLCWLTKEFPHLEYEKIHWIKATSDCW